MDGQEMPERLAGMTRGEAELDLVGHLPNTAASPTSRTLPPPA